MCGCFSLFDPYGDEPFYKSRGRRCWSMCCMVKFNLYFWFNSDACIKTTCLFCPVLAINQGLIVQSHLMRWWWVNAAQIKILNLYGVTMVPIWSVNLDSSIQTVLVNQMWMFKLFVKNVNNISVWILPKICYLPLNLRCIFNPMPGIINSTWFCQYVTKSTTCVAKYISL